jgi:hypothetical protein
MADITEREPAFLIAAVRQAVKRSSIRAVAAQSGLSPGGVHNLVTGSTRRCVYGKTINKLRAWYLREWAAGGDGLSSEAASYLVRQLLAPIRAEERAGAGLELVSALERIYASRGTPRPAWLHSVRDECRTDRACEVDVGSAAARVSQHP